MEKGRKIVNEQTSLQWKKNEHIHMNIYMLLNAPAPAYPYNLIIQLS